MSILLIILDRVAKINRKIAAGRFALTMALGGTDSVIMCMILRFAQGSGGHYAHSVLVCTHDPDQTEWVCNTVWSTHARMFDWWTVESDWESRMNTLSPYTITADHDGVNTDSVTDQDHVLFLENSYMARVWDFVANGDWRNWRLRDHPDPDRWNTQWSESAQCTAIDWVHDPLLRWADYERLCAKFDLTPTEAITQLHSQYHRCRRQQLAQYKEWWDAEWDHVNTQTREWFKLYDL